MKNPDNQRRIEKLFYAVAVFFSALLYACIWTLLLSAMDDNQLRPGSGLSLQSVKRSIFLSGLFLSVPCLVLQIFYIVPSAHFRFTRMLSGSTLTLTAVFIVLVLSMGGELSDIREGAEIFAVLLLTNAVLLTAIYLFRTKKIDESIDVKRELSRSALMTVLSSLVAVPAVFAVYVFGFETGEMYYHGKWSHEAEYWETAADLDEKNLSQISGNCVCITDKMDELKIRFPEQFYSEPVTRVEGSAFNFRGVPTRSGYEITGWQKVEVDRQTCVMRWRMPLETTHRVGVFVGKCSGESIIGRVYVPMKWGQKYSSGSGPPEVGSWIIE